MKLPLPKALAARQTLKPKEDQGRLEREELILLIAKEVIRLEKRQFESEAYYFAQQSLILIAKARIYFSLPLDPEGLSITLPPPALLRLEVEAYDLIDKLFLCLKDRVSIASGSSKYGKDKSQFEQELASFKEWSKK